MYISDTGPPCSPRVRRGVDLPSPTGPPREDRPEGRWRAVADRLEAPVERVRERRRRAAPLLPRGELIAAPAGVTLPAAVPLAVALLLRAVLGGGGVRLALDPRLLLVGE